MAKVPSKVQSRLAAGIKKFQPILSEAKARSVNESDTVIIIIEMLSEIFGYDKFTELTSEKEIRGNYCDLATVIDQKVQTLIEAKAINQLLKDNHVNQAVSYATNKGVDWVLLTNGVIWQVYKVLFTKPIDHELILEIDFLSLNNREENDLEKLFLLSKESWPKSALSDYCEQMQALSKYSICAIIRSDPILNAIRHELKQLSPDVKIDIEQILSVIEKEVLNPKIMEDDKSKEAQKIVARAANKIHKSKADKEVSDASIIMAQSSSAAPSIIISQPVVPPPVT